MNSIINLMLSFGLNWSRGSRGSLAHMVMPGIIKPKVIPNGFMRIIKELWLV